MVTPPWMSWFSIYFPKFRRAVVTMAAVIAEKTVSQLSISFPEATILLYNDGDH